MRKLGSRDHERDDRRLSEDQRSITDKNMAMKVVAVIGGFIALVTILSNISSAPLVIHDFSFKTNEHNQFQMCVLARYSFTQEKKWLGFIGSLLSASSESSRIHVVFVETDTLQSEVEQGHKRLASLLQNNSAFTYDNSFKVSISSLTNYDSRTKQYRDDLGIPPGKQDFGYILTDLALDDLVQSNSCEYILVTNGDNLYHANIMDATQKARRLSKTLIGFHMVSHHEWLSDSENIMKGIIDGPGKDILLRTRLEPNEVDLGAVLWHTESTFKNPEIRFSKNRDIKNFPDNIPQSFWTADGVTIGSVAQREGTTKEVIPRIMFVHL